MELAPGWLVMCLNVADIQRALEFYEKLDFAVVGGNQAIGWAALQHPSCELHLFQGHIDRNLLNFRGGDVLAIAAELRRHGLESVGGVQHEPDGSTGATYLDPDGVPAYFNTFPEEAARFQAGEPTSVQGAQQILKADALVLGNFAYCLKCADVERTAAYYEKLGLRRDGGDSDRGWVLLTAASGPAAPSGALLPPRLSLHQRDIDRNMLSFRGGDIHALARTLASRGVYQARQPYTDSEGGDNLFVTDPDGNIIHFVTLPHEQLT